MKKLYASFTACWAPVLEDSEDKWKEWADGKTELVSSDDAPKLEYTSPLFRRRLSQLTKMTVHAVRTTLQRAGFSFEQNGIDSLKIFSAGNFGEINRELQINSQLINDGEILPASFSLSVFNTAVAQTTLALKIHSGYAAAFGAKGNFYDSLAAAASAVLCGDEKEILFVWADENIPQEYAGIRKTQTETQSRPFVFSFILGTENKQDSAEFDLCDLKNSTAENFLKKLIHEKY